MHTDRRLQRDEVALEDKVACLSAPGTYSRPVDNVSVRETHMSCIFLASDRAFKLKKPVRFPYLDLSTSERREAACRAELNCSSIRRRRCRARSPDGLSPDVRSGCVTQEHFEPFARWLETAREEHSPTQATNIGFYIHKDGARARAFRERLDLRENRVLKRSAWQMRHDEIRDPERRAARELAKQMPGKHTVNVATLVLEYDHTTCAPSRI